MTETRKKPLLSLPLAIGALNRAAPGVPFAAFGQTPLWDEPMKAILAADAGRPMVVGIHDLDYFSRVRAPLSGERWQILPRNDNGTKDAWIAAGELSAFLGAEVWPTRQMLSDYGVRLDRVLPPEGMARQRLLDRFTEAWGWRGIVENAQTPSVACDLRARDVAPKLMELMAWGSRTTAGLLPRPENARAARAFGRRVKGWTADFVTSHPDASLTELYEYLLRQIYETLLGNVPENVSIRSLSGILRFNRATADAPRFRLLASFLNPRLNGPCRAAYDAALADSGVTSLAAYGEGSLPFDVHVPGKGRGTLFVTDTRIRIDLPVPADIPLEHPVRSVADLAAVLEKAFGPQIALVGKAVSLIAMCSAEFVMVFNETGTAYLPRTRQMLNAMSAAGAEIRAYPMLRLRFHTWDAFGACSVKLRLPEHLAQAFGRSTICADGFAHEWRRAVEGQRKLLEKIGSLLGSCELLDFLSQEEQAVWVKRLSRCNEANAVLLDVQRRSAKMRAEINTLRGKEDELADEIASLEKHRGELNRDRIRPLKRRLDAMPDGTHSGDRKRLQVEYQSAFNEGKALLLALEAKQVERRRLQDRRRGLGKTVHAVERRGRASAARRTLRVVERAVVRERLRLARNALMASRGLPHTDVRPSAWWMLSVDPSGKWFARIRETAEFRLEPLHGAEHAQ